MQGRFKDTILSLREDQMRESAGYSSEATVLVCVCVLGLVDSVLQYASKWNTNSRHCLVAQSMLSLLLSNQPPEKMMELEDIKSLLEGLLPYTERHLHRLSKLQQVRL